jgi:hypothetical protein
MTLPGVGLDNADGPDLPDHLHGGLLVLVPVLPVHELLVEPVGGDSRHGTHPELRALPATRQPFDPLACRLAALQLRTQLHEVLVLLLGHLDGHPAIGHALSPGRHYHALPGI